MEKQRNFDLMNKSYSINIDVDKFIDILRVNRGKKIELSENYFYHGTTDDIDILNLIYQKGILCKQRINKMYIPKYQNGTQYTGMSNGMNRVSVTKRSDLTNESAYAAFIKKRVSFILDDKIEAKKIPYAKLPQSLFEIAYNSVHTTSYYQDEWQVNDMIEPSHFVAIGLYILDRLNDNLYTDYGVMIKTLNVINWIEIYNIPLKFIDLTDNTEVYVEPFKEHLIRKEIKRYY